MQLSSQLMTAQVVHGSCCVQALFTTKWVAALSESDVVSCYLSVHLSTLTLSACLCI